MRFNRLVFPLFYLKHRGKDTAIVQADPQTRLKVRVNSSDVLLIWEIWRFKVYRRNGEAEYIRPESTIVDIGSHIGVFSSWAARQVPNGRVFAYEAASGNFTLLMENKKLNGLNNLFPYHLAVYDCPGRYPFSQPDGNGALGSIRQQDTGSSEWVTAVTLENILENHGLTRVDLLKLDVEGAEYPILLSTDSRVLRCVRNIVLEYHEFVDIPSRLSELVTYLQTCGFQVKVEKGLFGQHFLFGTGVIRAWRP